MKEELDNFYLCCDEPQRGTLLALRSLILEHDPAISETMKYGMPCFLYKRNIMCYLWTDGKSGEPYILMAEGGRLSSPYLEQGARKRMKIMRIDPDADLPTDKIAELMDEAIGLYMDGIVKLK